VPRARPSPSEWVEIHLGYDLKYLLVGATTWSCSRAFEWRADWPLHLNNLAQDSALLHTRGLYEFFVKDTKEWRQNRAEIGLAAPVSSPLFKKYELAINEKVHHVSPWRPFVASGSAGDDLHERVLDFAHDLVGIWDRVGTSPETAACHYAFAAAREAAIVAAAECAAWFNDRPQFT